MAKGPGKYDSLCTYVREKAEADMAIVLVRGAPGYGFSLQVTDPAYVKVLPTVLRELADSIEKDFGGADAS